MAETSCVWRDCQASATRRLGFGRVDPQKRPDKDGRHLLRARYCDEHADLVAELFLVESDAPLTASARAAA